MTWYNECKEIDVSYTSSERIDFINFHYKTQQIDRAFDMTQERNETALQAILNSFYGFSNFTHSNKTQLYWLRNRFYRY